mgnify:FL=1
MTTLATYYPFIVPDLPKCPEIAIDIELIRVANEYCNDGWVYRHEAEVSISVGDQEKEVSLPDGTQLVGIVTAEVNDSEFLDISVTGDSILLDNVATLDFDIELVLAVKPALTATTLPDFLLRDHLDAIVTGVKRRLFLSPGISWTNAELAMYYEKQYMDYVGSRAAESFQNGTSTKKRIDRRMGI